MSYPENEDLRDDVGNLRSNLASLKTVVEFLERRINHVSERAEVKYADHNTRIENLENVRIGLFLGIFLLLFLNLGGVVFVIFTK